jgi:hypothetical protein
MLAPEHWIYIRGNYVPPYPLLRGNYVPPYPLLRGNYVPPYPALSTGNPGNFYEIYIEKLVM